MTTFYNRWMIKIDQGHLICVYRAKQLLGPVFQLEREARAVFVRAMMLSSLVSTTGDEESGNGGQGQL
jgi:hypothetical protein